MSGMMVLREMSVECSAKIAMTALRPRSQQRIYPLIAIRRGLFFLRSAPCKIVNQGGTWGGMKLQPAHDRISVRRWQLWLTPSNRTIADRTVYPG